MNAAEIAERLGGSGRGSERGYMCLCPIHEDKSPSLSIMDGEGGKLLVHCFAGCDGSEIIAELRKQGLIKRSRASRASKKSHLKNIRAQLNRGDEVKRISKMTIAERLKTPKSPEMNELFGCEIFPQMPFDCPFEEYRQLYTKRRQTWRERAIYGRLPWEIEAELNEMRAEIMELHNENEKTDSK